MYYAYLIDARLTRWIHEKAFEVHRLLSYRPMKTPMLLCLTIQIVSSSCLSIQRANFGDDQTPSTSCVCSRPYFIDCHRTTLHPTAQRAVYRPPESPLSSCHGCQQTVNSSPPRPAVWPATASSNASSAPEAHCPCTPSLREKRVRWTGIGCRQLRGPCVAQDAGMFARELRRLRAERARGVGLCLCQRSG